MTASVKRLSFLQFAVYTERMQGAKFHKSRTISRKNAITNDDHEFVGSMYVSGKLPTYPPPPPKHNILPKTRSKW